MKTLSALILTALLSACGDGATVVASDTAQREPVQTVNREPILIVEAPRVPVAAPVRIEAPVVIEAPVSAPIVQVGCDLTTYIPCGSSTPPPAPVVTCNLYTYNPCGSFPPPGPDYELCDLTSYNPCANPTWVKRQV